MIDGEEYNMDKEFVYLRSTISAAGQPHKDVKARTGKASGAFLRMANVWKNREICTRTKIRLHNVIVIPTLLHASETWQMLKAHNKTLNTFHQRCLQRRLGVCWWDKVTSADV